MKKIVSLLLSVGLLVSLMGILSACGHTHSFSEEWLTDKANHWHACTEQDCPECADMAAHTYDEGAITASPSLTADGVRTFTCTVCGYTRTEDIVSDTRVAKEEWQSILGLRDTDNLKITATGSRVTGANTPIPMSMTYELDGHTIYMKSTSGEVTVMELYLTQEGDQYTAYPYDMSSKIWTSTPITPSDYERYRQDFSRLFAYEDFEYHTVSRTYFNAKPIEYDGTTITDVEIGIVNGALVKIAYTQSTTDTSVTYRYSFFYGEADITLPTVATE